VVVAIAKGSLAEQVEEGRQGGWGSQHRGCGIPSLKSQLVNLKRCGHWLILPGWSYP